jgi:hypothetical protein
LGLWEESCKSRELNIFHLTFFFLFGSFNGVTSETDWNYSGVVACLRNGKANVYFKTLRSLQDGHIRLRNIISQAAPWLRRLVAGLSPLTPGSVNLGFVVDKLALEQAFLRIIRFSPVNIIPPLSIVI